MLLHFKSDSQGPLKLLNRASDDAAGTFFDILRFSGGHFAPFVTREDMYSEVLGLARLETRQCSDLSISSIRNVRSTGEVELLMH